MNIPPFSLNVYIGMFLAAFTFLYQLFVLLDERESLCTLKPDFFRVIEHHLPNFFQRAKRVRYKSSRRSLMEAINVVSFDWLIIFVH